MADLDTLPWLVNEYRPARSVLVRVHTDIYNRAPTVWNDRPISEQGWPNSFWSLFSDVAWPGDDGDVAMSFGTMWHFLSERYNETGAELGVESRTDFLAPYIGWPMQNHSVRNDVFLRNHGFTIGEIVSLYWCMRTTNSYPWHGV